MGSFQPRSLDYSQWAPDCHFLSVSRGLGSSREKYCSVSQGACVLGLISPLIMLHWGNQLPFLGFSFPIYEVEALKPPGRVILFL